jgi:tetratricopeptide (TPR) repeat protein
MRLLKIIGISGLVLLGWISELPGQNYSKDELLRFADYLYENKDYSRASYEYLRVYHLFETNDSEKLALNLKIGQCFGFLNQPDNASQYFQYCLTEKPPGAVYSQALMQMGFLLFRGGQYQESRSFLEEKKTSPSNIMVNTLILANVLCQGDVGKARELFNQYKNDGISYIHSFDKYLGILSDFKFKSPLKAAIMSAILPGSGRIYTGRVKEGILSMVSFFATSYLAYEGFHEDGIKSFRGWLFSSIGAFLYIGNIYGSVLSARLMNDQLRQGFNRGVELSLQIYIND